MRISLVALMTIGLLFSTIARSQEGGVFTATAEIENQSANELNAGADEALLSLLKAMTLETEQAKLAPILGQTKSLLKQAIFLGASQASSSRQVVSYDFDAQALTQAIFSAGLGLVPVERPRPLLWWVVRDLKGEIRYLDVNQDAAVVERVKSLLNEYRLNFDIPLYDLTDTLTVSSEALWQSQPVALARGMLRYQPQTQRLVKWAELSDNRILLNVLSLDEGRVDSLLEAIYTDQEAAFAALVELLIQRIRSELAVVADDSDLPDIVIDGLTNFQDYRQIVRTLEANVFVESVRVIRLEGQSLTLGIESPASRDQFKQILQDALNLEYLEINELGMRFGFGQ
ncbi:MAG: DUF2066 domain-containing protein [Halieaceae bacterium]|nr:DUF2066 domain-containing protein [Halieaceae bacterium]